MLGHGRGGRRVKRRLYLEALLRQSSDWIRLSAENPNKFMTKNQVLLHYVALKIRGEL